MRGTDLLEHKAQDEAATSPAAITTAAVTTSPYGRDEFQNHRKHSVGAYELRCFVTGQLGAAEFIDDCAVFASRAATAFAACGQYGREARYIDAAG